MKICGACVKKYGYKPIEKLEELGGNCDVCRCYTASLNIVDRNLLTIDRLVVEKIAFGKQLNNDEIKKLKDLLEE